MRWMLRTWIGGVIGIAASSCAAVLLSTFCFSTALSRAATSNENDQSNKGYVGSKACAQCHPSIYQSFSRTDMGRSMSEITPSLLEKLGHAQIFDSKLNRHFEAYARAGDLYQTEYATDEKGSEVFRDTHKLEWIIGSGANGSGAIIQRDDYLFEAPLSFYAKLQGWAMSPGYEFGDYGFKRPILPACISCHSGQPRAVLDGNGRFRQPPFKEVAIGCENCHGPGQTHIATAQMGSPQGSITNPAKLSHWLADNICMSCHQAGDARVLQEGKDYRDFRPGGELDQTLSIFLVPFGKESTPKDDLLEHYLSMRLSQCYLKSGGQLSCITCHNPHLQPSAQEAPAYFRQKCLTCHSEKSCALPLALRERKTPPNDCAGCHMPKRDVKVISHSVLTNHRIVAQAEEPFPDAAFHMTSPGLPDLVHLNATSAQEKIPALVLLQAYGQVMLAHPQYRERYWSVAKQLQASEPENFYVLEALADSAMQQHSSDGAAQAMKYLEAAIHHGSTNPADFEQLAKLLIGNHREMDASKLLENGIQLLPFDAELYRLSAHLYFSQQKPKEACDTVVNAVQKFPQDDAIRVLRDRCPASGNGNP